ncbi:MAG: Cell division protein FtsN [Desulfovibrio sp.]
MTHATEQREGPYSQPGQSGQPGKAGKPEKKRLRDRTVTLTISLPKAFFGALFFLFVLVWVFIFGILIGRGHNPEEVVPELAKVMPDSSGTSQSAPPPADEVLQSRDLKYHDSLKGKGATQPPRVSPSPAPQKPTAQPGATPTAKPADTSKPTPQPQKPTAQSSVPPVDPDQDQTVYNYLYQVAAFNNARQAQTMQSKLQNGGLNTKVTETQANGSTWYRVLVSFKGKPEDTRKLRQKLSEHGISNVILRGKAPAS